ncbi:MAG TPA: helix-turn-helix transcriptional regulator [Clostridia bacterium]
MKPVKQIIAQNLSELRKQNKLTQLELAERLNYSDKAISRWERGDTLPDIDVLCQLADMYGVSFEYLITEGSMHDKSRMMTKKERSNKLTITLLAISLVWFLATIIFVYSNLFFSYIFWQVFVWAIPTSLIVAIIFNSIWGKRKNTFIFISCMVWTALGSLYIQLIQYNIWLVFILGVPVQIAIVLWSNLKK